LTILAPTMEVRVLDGAGHVPQRTHPDALVAVLFAFDDQLGVVDEGRGGDESTKETQR